LASAGRVPVPAEAAFEARRGAPAGARGRRRLPRDLRRYRDRRAWTVALLRAIVAGHGCADRSATGPRSSARASAALAPVFDRPAALLGQTPELGMRVDG